MYKIGNRKYNGFLFRNFLWLCSRVFYGVIALRHFAYKKGILQKVEGALPIVSVGNILAGGCGKTPFTMLLAEKIPQCAIVSRGYKGKRLKVPVYVTDIKTGDEPYLMAKALPHIPVIVSRVREKGVELAAALGRKLVLLDDGMQYIRLNKAYEIILLRADNLWGEGAYLPLGNLREQPQRIAAADIIVVHGVRDARHSQECIATVKARFCDKNVMTTRYRIENKKMVEGKRVGAFCGIGHPESFFRLLTEAKCDILRQRQLMDHARMRPQVLQRFIEDCLKEGAEYVVCTEKDRIKYPQIGNELQPVRVRMEIVEGHKVFDNAIKAIRRLTSEF